MDQKYIVIPITNVATSDNVTYGASGVVRGASAMQVLVKTTDPTVSDRSFVNDIVYQNGALPDNNNSVSVRFQENEPCP